MSGTASLAKKSRLSEAALEPGLVFVAEVPAFLDLIPGPNNL